MVTSTNTYGFSSSSGDNTFTALAPITLTITSPLEGETIIGHIISAIWMGQIIPCLLFDKQKIIVKIEVFLDLLEEVI